MMSHMSDLELVAQAMAPTEQPAPNSNPTSDQQVSAPPADAGATAAADTDLFDQKGLLAELDSLDLSGMPPAERAALEKLVEMYKKVDGDMSVEGDVDVEDILAQMEAADKVTGVLEERLDGLLAKLGQAEADLVEQGGETLAFDDGEDKGA